MEPLRNLDTKEVASSHDFFTAQKATLSDFDSEDGEKSSSVGDSLNQSMGQKGSQVKLRRPAKAQNTKSKNISMKISSVFPANSRQKETSDVTSPRQSAASEKSRMMYNPSDTLQSSEASPLLAPEESPSPQSNHSFVFPQQVMVPPLLTKEITEIKDLLAGLNLTETLKGCMQLKDDLVKYDQAHQALALSVEKLLDRQETMIEKIDSIHRLLDVQLPLLSSQMNSLRVAQIEQSGAPTKSSFASTQGGQIERKNPPLLSRTLPAHFAEGIKQTTAGGVSNSRESKAPKRLSIKAELSSDSDEG